MEVDLLIMLPWVNQSSKPGGPRTTRCSDVSGLGAMGHNEDNDDAFVGLCFLVAGKFAPSFIRRHPGLEGISVYCR